MADSKYKPLVRAQEANQRTNLGQMLGQAGSVLINDTDAHTPPTAAYEFKAITFIEAGTINELLDYGSTSTRTLDLADASDFAVGDIITGGTSGATARVVSKATNTLSLDCITGIFQNGEAITNQDADASTAASTLSACPYAGIGGYPLSFTLFGHFRHIDLASGSAIAYLGLIDN